jgi:hypothetical protein
VGYELWGHTSYPAFEDGTDRWFRNVGIQKSDTGDTPKRVLTILFLYVFEPCIFTYFYRIKCRRMVILACSYFGSLEVAFAPRQSRRIFRAKKIPQHAFLRRGNKAVGPMS